MIPLIIAIPCCVIVVALITYYGTVKIIESQIDLSGFRKEFVYTFPILVLGIGTALIVTIVTFLSIIQWLDEIAK